jgi:hypothetical protein
MRTTCLERKPKQQTQQPRNTVTYYAAAQQRPLWQATSDKNAFYYRRILVCQYDYLYHQLPLPPRSSGIACLRAFNLRHLRLFSAISRQRSSSGVRFRTSSFNFSTQLFLGLCFVVFALTSCYFSRVKKSCYNNNNINNNCFGGGEANGFFNCLFCVSSILIALAYRIT